MKTYKLPVTLVIMTLLVQLLATNFSYIDSAGYVHEPGFFTVPLGIFVISGSIVRIVWLLLKPRVKKSLNR
ncbi:DUF3955 domain-containing protein [Lacticaseibacillus brantae]|uniref:DUF3955 domain-containing protein n=1 Tax=Lacticaseibacillus brantae TaxID=943673 RepID=UPI0009F91979|nr:DUF3955 domain-containing protein [Lacticaseibacillus brantae]